VTTQTAAVAQPPQPDEDSELDIQKLLDVLVPPASISVTDIFGNEYTVPSACSARAQVKILNVADGLKKNETLATTMSGDVDLADIGAIIGLVVTICADEEVMASLAKAFEIGHPIPYGNSSSKAKELGVPFDDAADLFPVEELAGAVVPLFIRLVRKGTTAVQSITKATGGIL